jgi:hypothetical protein
MPWYTTRLRYATRALQFQLALILVGMVLLYVDDAMGACRIPDVDSEMGTSKREFRSLLGPNAGADDKDERGRALDNIGYRVDLDARRIGIALKNLHSAFYAFFSLPVDGRVTKHWRRATARSAA